MKLKTIKFGRKIKKNKRKQKVKHRLLASFFAIVIIVATIVNNCQNYCKAINDELYNALKIVMNDQIPIKQNDKITYIDLKEYLIGVLAGEMAPTNQEEALKSQALTAFNYAAFHLVNDYLNNRKNPVSANSDFQVYIDKENRQKKFGINYEKYEAIFKKTVDSIKDLVITYTDKNGKERLADTVYFSGTGGGKTEDAKNIWGTEITYLKSVDSSFEKSTKQNVKINLNEAFNLIKNYFDSKNKNVSQSPQNSIMPAIPIDMTDSLKIESRNDSGRVQQIIAFGVKMNGDEFRQLFNLKSTNFTVEGIKTETTNKEKTTYVAILTVDGYGHGVGMSQDGANELAKQGKKFDEIIKHYYTGVQIKNIENLIN